MAVTNLHDITRASQDADLLKRIAAAAAELGIRNPQAWAEVNAGLIVSQPVTEAGDTPASVYAYADDTWTPTPLPGANPAAVTDEYIRTAVSQARSVLEA